MPKFNIFVTRTEITKFDMVEIEAETLEQAKEQAIEVAEDGGLTEDTSDEDYAAEGEEAA